tara:strand:+ start:2278 stop:2766 length:489 start_codon:yes stop_codon:yes gene_type:complete
MENENSPVGLVDLRSLLMGPSLEKRAEDRECILQNQQSLSAHVRGISNVIEDTYGPSQTATVAAREVEQIADLPEGNGEAACKRAMILFALRREPEIMHAFVEHDKRLGNPKFADDMIHRVLPFVCPRFLNDSAQCPNRFVLLCLLLSEMWAGERLGNWPAL